MASYKGPSALLSALLLAASSSTMAAVDVLSIWNYDDPAASEARFRELAKSADPDDAAILETQIARTYGLRGRFDEARDVLSGLQPRLVSPRPEARVRYHLEYGRTLISPVHKKAQRTEEARAAARSAYLTAYELASAVLHAMQHIKPRLCRPGVVANPRDTTGYRCGLRLAKTANPSVLSSAAQHATLH